MYLFSLPYKNVTKTKLGIKNVSLCLGGKFCVLIQMKSIWFQTVFIFYFIFYLLKM